MRSISPPDPDSGGEKWDAAPGIGVVEEREMLRGGEVGGVEIEGKVGTLVMRDEDENTSSTCMGPGPEVGVDSLCCRSAARSLAMKGDVACDRTDSGGEVVGDPANRKGMLEGRLDIYQTPVS